MFNQIEKICCYWLLVCVILVGTITSSVAQDEKIAADTSTYKKSDDFSLSAFPLVFYLPETGLAFGGVGICVFNVGKEKAWRKSQAQIGLAYTLKNQFLAFVPYELYYKDSWKLHGELGYYRYFYNYFGIGIDSKIEDLETFDANFPRFLGTLSYRVQKSLLVGVQYRFDYFDIPRTDSLLTLDNPVGIDGGMVSSIGLAVSYDTRNDVFYPSKGVLIDFSVENSGKWTLADFDYSLIQLQATLYKEIVERHILVANAFTGATIGESSFLSYYYLSSGKRARGFNDRRFIDKHIMVGQLEYRYPIYKRFTGVAFSSLGTVADEYAQLFQHAYKFSYGLGLRYQLSKKQKSNVRVDVANSVEGFQFYITIGEAF